MLAWHALLFFGFLYFFLWCFFFQCKNLIWFFYYFFFPVLSSDVILRKVKVRFVQKFFCFSRFMFLVVCPCWFLIVSDLNCIPRSYTSSFSWSSRSSSFPSSVSSSPSSSLPSSPSSVWVCSSSSRLWLQLQPSCFTSVPFIVSLILMPSLIIHFALACRSPQRSDVDNPTNNLHVSFLTQ